MVLTTGLAGKRGVPVDCGFSKFSAAFSIEASFLRPQQAAKMGGTDGCRSKMPDNSVKLNLALLVGAEML